MKNQRVLITGASSGIGCEFAKVFAKNGHSLILTARREERMQELGKKLNNQYGVSVKVFRQDLSQPGSGSELFEKIQREGLEVDILVNNAGYATHGFFPEIDLKRELEEIQLNVTSLTELTKKFSQRMMQRRTGKILNVASTAAFQPGPLMAVYYATKAYVLSFSEAVREELRGSGVTVSVLCPGPTASEFQEKAGIQEMRLLRLGKMSAEKVALAGYHGLKEGKAVIVPGFMNWMIMESVRLGPRALVRKIVHFLQMNRKKG
ncbi:MAG: SDR family oxidoreductase [Candidatus Omnitrophica bacterium]|nr:SDR family oxidoreductase [Candidatus Omnitrophota bacterium]